MISVGKKKKKVTCYFNKQRILSTIKPLATAATLASVPWGECGMRKNRILTLNSEDAYPGDKFNQPRHIQRSTEFTNLRCLLFVISSNLLTFNYTFNGFSCLFFPEKKKCHTSYFLSYLFRTVLHTIPERLSPRLWSSVRSPNKMGHNFWIVCFSSVERSVYPCSESNSATTFPVWVLDEPLQRGGTWLRAGC